MIGDSLGMTQSALLKWTGFDGLPDFSNIKDEDFKPAFDAALNEAQKEIETIAASEEKATIEGFLKLFEPAGPIKFDQ